MPIYWTYKNLPELSALSDAERKVVWRRAVRQAFESWQTWASAALIIPLVFIGAWIGASIGHESIGMAIGAGLSGGITERVVFRIARSCLKTTHSGAHSR
jgi:hypothetical protein